MRSVNKITLLGNLGQGPEKRKTKKGTDVTSFSLATSEQYKDREGNKQEATEWHRVVTWGKLAEIAGKYLKKGSKVYLEGRIKTDSYEDKEGNKRYNTQIHAFDIVMLDSKGNSEGGKDEDDLPF